MKKRSSTRGKSAAPTRMNRIAQKKNIPRSLLRNKGFFGKHSTIGLIDANGYELFDKNGDKIVPKRG